MEYIFLQTALEHLLPIVLSFAVAILSPYLGTAFKAYTAIAGTQMKERHLARVDELVDRALDWAISTNAVNPKRQAAEYVWEALRDTIQGELGGAFHEIAGRVDTRAEQRHLDPFDPLELRAEADAEADKTPMGQASITATLSGSGGVI